MKKLHELKQYDVFSIPNFEQLSGHSFKGLFQLMQIDRSGTAICKFLNKAFTEEQLIGIAASVEVVSHIIFIRDEPLQSAEIYEVHSGSFSPNSQKLPNSGSV